MLADVVDECELLGVDVEALRDRLACHSLRVGPGDSVDQYRVGFAVLVIENGVQVVLRLLMPGQMPLLNGVNPAKPALQVGIALVHHSDVLLALRVDHVELREQAAGFQLLHVLHPRLHEGLQLEGRRVVVVVAEDRMVAVLESSRRMRETRRENVEVSHGLEADAVVGVDFADLSGDDVVGVLHVDALRKAGHHDQRVSVLVARPRLVDQLIGNHILAALESPCYFFPVGHEHVPHSVVIIPQCAEPLRHGVAHVVLGPRMLAALERIAVLVEGKSRQLDRSWESFGDLVRDGPNGNSICAKFLAEDVLVELDESVDAILPCQFHSVSH